MFNIAKRVFLINIRSTKYVWFCMAFPIILMTMIGAVLTNAFETGTDISKLTVHYLDKGTKESSAVFKSVKENKGNLEIEFKEINSVEEGKDKVRINEDGFIYIEGDHIKIYTNDKNFVHTGMLNGMFNGVNNRMNAIIEIFKANPEGAHEIVNEKTNMGEFKTEAIAKVKTPSSFDYYGVAELTLMVIYLALFPLGDMSNEKRLNLKSRIKLSGLSNFKYYLGLLMGYSALSLVITLPGYIYSIFALNTNWGSSYILPYIIIVIFSIMTISFGMALGVMIRDKQKVETILNSVVFPVIAFLGGSYMNLPDNAGGLFQIITNLSPLRWMNRGILRMAFLNDYSIIRTGILINIGVITVSIILIMMFSKREEAM